MMSDSISSPSNGPGQSLTLRPLLEYWAMPHRGRDRIRQFCIVAVVASLLVILQPFGSFQEPFAGRLAYWLVMLCVMVWFILPALARIFISYDRIAGLAVVPGTLLLYLVASLPMTLIVGMVDMTANGAMPVMPANTSSLYAFAGWLASLSWPDGLVANAMALFAKVAAIGLLSMGLITLIAAGRWARTRPAMANPLIVRPGLKFFSRLPPHLGTTLVLMRMEDHYIRVVTRDGQALILMRLSDAIGELSDFPGLQVHRSWWVATAEIQSVTRRGKGLSLIMSDSSQVPVSPRFRAEVEALLWGESAAPASVTPLRL